MQGAGSRQTRSWLFLRKIVKTGSSIKNDACSNHRGNRKRRLLAQAAQGRYGMPSRQICHSIPSPFWGNNDSKMESECPTPAPSRVTVSSDFCRGIIGMVMRFLHLSLTMHMAACASGAAFSYCLPDREAP